jgi:putative ABC transport system substrate-binding protein
MIKRRAFIVGGLTGIAAPLAVSAQQAAKVYRLAFLAEGAFLEPRYRTALEGALEHFGYRVGDRLILEYRYAGGDTERLRREASGIVQKQFDIIITNTNPATAAAQQETKSIPIVMVTATSVIQAGFVQTLARPGRNITGLTADAAPETMLGKQLSLLREIKPSLSRVGVLWNPAVPAYRQYFETLQGEATPIGIKLHSMEVHSPTQLEGAFVQGLRQHVEALFIFVDVLTFIHRQTITELAVKYRLPNVAYFREFAESGGLLAYGVDLTYLYRRTAYYVDRIIKGEQPANLPVEQPSKFLLVINLKTAKALGLMIPPSLLLRADQVIE